VTHLKCPDCEITLIDRSGLEASKRCPRCLLRSGAVVEMIRSMRAASTNAVQKGQTKHA
jgi:Zn-finger nucleic acid-binding protein